MMKTFNLTGANLPADMANGLNGDPDVLGVGDGVEPRVVLSGGDEVERDEHGLGDVRVDERP